MSVVEDHGRVVLEQMPDVLERLLADVDDLLNPPVDSNVAAQAAARRLRETVAAIEVLVVNAGQLVRRGEREALFDESANGKAHRAALNRTRDLAKQAARNNPEF